MRKEKGTPCISGDPTKGTEIEQRLTSQTGGKEESAKLAPSRNPGL
jgi:hypothetical protein